MSRRRKVLVVGSGGREHALAVRLLESESVGEVLLLPGNAGTSVSPGWAAGKMLRNVAGEAVEIARREAVDLVVVGPEAPLCAGLSDELAGAGIAVFGPSRAAARLEGSKAFMKDFAVRHGLPTARHVVVTDAAEAERAVRSFSAPPVVKADGLCAGKGVVVADTHAEAIEAAQGMLTGALFGEAGKIVVLEERVLGAEASMHAVSDGERFVVLSAAQDHKRIGDGDRGPNTGGMGTYAPAPLVTPALAERVRREIFAPAFAGMKGDGMPYKGVLFAGLMVTPAGEPILLEFNVRFGDPETQVLVMTTAGDFGDAFAGAASGTLSETALAPNGEHAVCIVLAAAGYPDAPKKGDVIAGIDAAESLEGVRVFHAGTSRSGSDLVTAGGRVLGVTARAGSLREAHARAYAAAERVRFDGAQFRRDIAGRALG
ncbi:MAG TPA: phosphoribosylamine--glycine ligase [Polyangiaceae bacterium]